MASGSQYEFGSYRLDAQSGMLFREGERVALSPQVAELLVALVQAAGSVVLPFENLITGERYDYFSDGLTEEKIAKACMMCSRCKPKWLEQSRGRSRSNGRRMKSSAWTPTTRGPSIRRRMSCVFGVGTSGTGGRKRACAEVSSASRKLCDTTRALQRPMTGFPTSTRCLPAEV